MGWMAGGRSADCRSGRRVRWSAALALAGVASLALPALGGSTLARFIDVVSGPAAEITAATLVVGIPDDGARPELAFLDLAPGERRAGALTVRNDGTVPADLSLEFRSDGDSAFCRREGGVWAPLPGSSLTVTIDGAEHAYCDLLGAPPVRIGSDVGSGTARDVDLAVELTAADHRFSELIETEPFVVRAVQAGGAGFTDDAAGSMRITTARITPTLPPECAHMDIAPDNVVVLGPGQTTWDAAAVPGDGPGPFLVLGTAGDDTITGSDEGDCLAGGGGDDTLTGGNGDDVLLGGAGNDVLDGGNGEDALRGGEGDDVLNGGNGRDDLVAGPGADRLAGGRGADRHEGGDGEDVCAGERDTPADEILDCETVESDPAAATLQQSPSPAVTVPAPAGGVREPAPSSVPGQPQTPPQPAAKPEPQPEQKPAPKAEPEPAKPEPQPEPDPKPKPDPVAPPPAEEAPAADATPPVQPAT